MCKATQVRTDRRAFFVVPLFAHFWDFWVELNYFRKGCGPSQQRSKALLSFVFRPLFYLRRFKAAAAWPLGFVIKALKTFRKHLGRDPDPAKIGRSFFPIPFHIWLSGLGFEARRPQGRFSCLRLSSTERSRSSFLCVTSVCLFLSLFVSLFVIQSD